MQPLPLQFHFKQTFLVMGHVETTLVVHGKALLEFENYEPGQYWISAIRPVGFASWGYGAGDVVTKFRRDWEHIVDDFVAEATSLDHFNSLYGSFAGSCNSELSEIWDGAVAEHNCLPWATGKYEFDPSIAVEASTMLGCNIEDLSFWSAPTKTDSRVWFIVSHKGNLKYCNDLWYDWDTKLGFTW